MIPFPHYDIDGNQKRGTLINIPEICKVCPTQKCRDKKTNELSSCSYGYNYYNKKELSCFGFIIDPPTNANLAMIKQRKKNPNNVIKKDQFESFSEELAIQIKFGKDQIIQKYKSSEQYRVDVITELRQDLYKQFSFVHDYKQINAQILQNMNILLISKYKNTDVEQVIDHSEQYEKAIYYAAKLLDEKLKVSVFLLDPDLLQIRQDIRRFNFFSATLKLIRIYKSRFEEKKVNINIHGTSYKEIQAIPNASDVIPQTLIDNACKYAHPCTSVDIYFKEQDDGIYFCVESYGPEIYDDEFDKIFEFAYRGRKAQKGIDGMGHGLFLSQMIAKEHFGTTLKVIQDKSNKKGSNYLTRFEMIFPERCALLRKS